MRKFSTPDSTSEIQILLLLWLPYYSCPLFVCAVSISELPLQSRGFGVDVFNRAVRVVNFSHKPIQSVVERYLPGYQSM